MTSGQAQHCIICGSQAYVQSKDQTLCLPCATPRREDETGEFVKQWTCPSCFTEGSLILRESGYLVCDECWHDEIDPEYGEELML